MDSRSASDYEDERSPQFLAPILGDPIGVLVRRWKPMLAAVMFVVVGSIVAAFQMEPLCEARATVSVLGARISENFVQTTVEIGTLDQIDANTVGSLEVAWRWSAANFGPQPEGNVRATPLMMG